MILQQIEQYTTSNSPTNEICKYVIWATKIPNREIEDAVAAIEEVEAIEEVMAIAEAATHGPTTTCWSGVDEGGVLINSF